MKEGRGGRREGSQTVKGRRGSFSPQSHEFLWTGLMLPHIFWPALTSGLLFPLIRVQCSRVMGIRARRKSPERWARSSQ